MEFEPNNNLAITNRSRVSCAYVEGIYRPKYYILHRDLEIWLRDHSRSLKLVPFASLGAVSYSPSIVGLIMALSCIVCDI